MTINESGIDRIARAVIAVVALVIAYVAGFGTLLGIIALIVALVMAVTAAVGFCPLYKVFGFSTCPAPKH